MKRIVSCVVSALIALAFAGLVSAADSPATATATPNVQQPSAEMKSGAKAKSVKKVKKEKKKAQKAREEIKEMQDTGPTPEAAPVGK